MNNCVSCHECELKDTCSFYWNYRDHPMVREKKLIENYCLSQEMPGGCQRISYYREFHEYPPTYLGPDGNEVPGQLIPVSESLA